MMCECFDYKSVARQLTPGALRLLDGCITHGPQAPCLDEFTYELQEYGLAIVLAIAKSTVRIHHTGRGYLVWAEAQKKRGEVAR